MQMVPIGRHSKSIVQPELRWYKNQPRLNLNLDVSTNPIHDTRGNPIPLTSLYGKCGFKNEDKSIAQMGFSDPVIIASRNKLPFVHPFILNNVLQGKGHTNQRQYLNNMINFIKLNLGLDLTQVNESNVQTWDQIICTALQGKMLVADWAQWWNWNSSFAGPDGTNMAIV